MASRPVPVQVSPIIKGARWSLLLSGIFYGMFKKSVYSGYESRLRPIREQQNKEREEQLEILSNESFKELIIEIAGYLEIEMPPDFELPP